ncbi:MAG: hypothetical protein VXX28_06070 [Verrucomicrobiota bacterium]|nr:hypothetical protein [Verrucomicrobiota bacterium]
MSVIITVARVIPMRWRLGLNRAGALLALYVRIFMGKAFIPVS